MNWIKMTIRTTTEGAELVTALLMELGINGAMIEDKNDIALNQRPEGQWDIIDEAIALRMDDDVLVSSYIRGGRARAGHDCTRAGVAGQAVEAGRGL